MINIADQKGLTLIETIIYIAILGVIITSMLSIMFAFIDTTEDNTNEQELVDAAQVLSQKIADAVQGAIVIGSPQDGGSGDQLQLWQRATNGDWLLHRIEPDGHGGLVIKVGAMPETPLLSDTVQLDNLVFSRTDYSDDPEITLIHAQVDISSTANTTVSRSLDFWITNY